MVRVKGQPVSKSDVLCVATKPFSSVQPNGIELDRALISPLVQAYSLPGAWNAAFEEDSGVVVRLPVCCDLRSSFVRASLEVHWQPVPVNPYDPGWQLLSPLEGPPAQGVSRESEVAAAAAAAGGGDSGSELTGSAQRTAGLSAAAFPSASTGVYCRLPAPGNVIVSVNAAAEPIVDRVWVYCATTADPARYPGSVSSLELAMDVSLSAGSMMGSLAAADEAERLPVLELGCPTLFSVQLLPFRPGTHEAATFLGGHLGRETHQPTAQTSTP